MTDEAATLVLEVIARPDDDGVRAVLADLLQAAGDPRGELISLQLLASRGNRDRDNRIQELLDTHAKSWLGWLRDAAIACRFDRGFLSRLALGSAWASDDVRWDDAARDGALATVEDLLPGSERGAIYRKFVTSPAMPNLRRVAVYDTASLDALAKSTAAIEHVACDSFTSDVAYADEDRQERVRGRHIAYRRARGLDPYDLTGDDTDDEFEDAEDTGWINTDDPIARETHYRQLWEVVARKPWVTSLGIMLEQLDHIIRLPWFSRIEALTIGGGQVRACLSRWHALGRRRMTLVPVSSLEPCERRFPWDFKIEVIPRDRRATASISGEWLIMPTSVLEALPPEVDRIEVERSSDVIAQRIRDAVARPGVEVVEVPQRANNFVWEIRDGVRSS